MMAREGGAAGRKRDGEGRDRNGLPAKKREMELCFFPEIFVKQPDIACPSGGKPAGLSRHGRRG